MKKAIFLLGVTACWSSIWCLIVKPIEIWSLLKGVTRCPFTERNKKSEQCKWGNDDGNDDTDNDDDHDDDGNDNDNDNGNNDNGNNDDGTDDHNDDNDDTGRVDILRSLLTHFHRACNEAAAWLATSSEEKMRRSRRLLSIWTYSYFIRRFKMAAVAQGNTALLSFAWNSAKRCPLSSQGQAFNFSVAIGKYFCIYVFLF